MYLTILNSGQGWKGRVLLALLINECTACINKRSKAIFSSARGISLNTGNSKKKKLKSLIFKE